MSELWVQIDGSNCVCKVSVGVGKEEADRERQREGMKEGRKNKFGDCLNFYFLCFSSPRPPRRHARSCNELRPEALATFLHFFCTSLVWGGGFILAVKVGCGSDLHSHAHTQTHSHICGALLRITLVGAITKRPNLTQPHFGYFGTGTQCCGVRVMRLFLCVLHKCVEGKKKNQ